MNKKVLIIGGSSGLGRQLATVYASKGYTVGVLARRGHLLTELKNEYPSIIIQQADIAEASIGEVVGQMIGTMKGLDIVILSASIIHINTELTPLPEEETISINVTGYTRIITTAWPYLKSAGGGQIVGITSIAGARGNKWAPAYHASKAFQSVYLESLRIKAKHENNNIRITELIPGYMNTQMAKGDRKFWVASVEKAARQSYMAIQRNKKRAFITKRWWLVYHVQRLLPIFIYDWVSNGKWKFQNRQH